MNSSGPQQGKTDSRSQRFTLRLVVPYNLECSHWPYCGLPEARPTPSWPLNHLRPVDFARAKSLLPSVARGFGPKDAVARARRIVAEDEIALASRDLGRPAKTLDGACFTLEKHGDRLNAGYASYLEVRRLLLIVQLEQAD